MQLSVSSVLKLLLLLLPASPLQDLEQNKGSQHHPHRYTPDDLQSHDLLRMVVECLDGGGVPLFDDLALHAELGRELVRFDVEVTR